MLLREHRSELAADFPRFYRIPLSRVRDEVALWEFAAMAANLPRESAAWRALHGQERVEWDLSAQLLAEAVNALRILVWQQTRDGERGRNRPKPILPPWAEDEDRDVQKFGRDPVPLDELNDFLGWEAELNT